MPRKTRKSKIATQPFVRPPFRGVRVNEPDPIPASLFPPKINPFQVGVGTRFMLEGTFQQVDPYAFMWDAKIGCRFVASGCIERNEPETCIRAAVAEVHEACGAIFARRNKS